MSVSDFQNALRFVLKWEGGKSDDPSDPGGRTAYGITQGTFHGWLHRRGQTERDVYTITPDEVEAIYREGFWETIHGDELAWPLSLAAFDAAVNLGPGVSRRWLGDVQWHDVDPKTAAFAHITLRRIGYQERVKVAPIKAKFLRGWLNRCEDLAKECGL